MTKAYQQLKQGPQTNVDRGSLKLAERQEVRKISVSGTPGHAKANTPGTYTTIYYLEGDEQAAVKRFVEENRALLEQIDFTKKKNALLTSVAREMYDQILHEMGLRIVTKFETVVLEERPDGIKWVIDRQKYENHPNRRYTSTESGSAQVPPGVSLSKIFDEFDNIIAESDLERTLIKGDVRQVLDYYRLSDEYLCFPATASNGQLAVRKIE